MNVAVSSVLIAAEQMACLVAKEHGVFMVGGMADGELKKSGGEGIGVCPKHFVPWVLTPVMG